MSIDYTDRPKSAQTALGSVVDFPQKPPLRKVGVGRVAGDPRDLSVSFNREPTDEELRMIDDFLQMMVNQSGVMEGRTAKGESGEPQKNPSRVRDQSGQAVGDRINEKDGPD